MSENHILEVASAEEATSGQRVFLRYFTAVLIDLVVINLFAEYWEYVELGSFSVSLAVALLLQVLLTLTLKIEHRVADFFNARNATVMRFASAWLILFLSKFLMLWAIDVSFGDQMQFLGPWHGVVAFIAVIMTMLAAEELVVRFYRRLGTA